MNFHHLRSWAKQACVLSPLLFNIVIEVLAAAISQEKEAKKHANWKESNKTLFVNDMDCLHRNFKESTETLQHKWAQEDHRI